MSGDAPAPVPPVGVSWYKSQRFIALCQSEVVIVVTWSVDALTSNAFNLRGLAIILLGNLGLVLKDWWHPNIIAPFARMNRLPGP